VFTLFVGRSTQALTSILTLQEKSKEGSKRGSSCIKSSISSGFKSISSGINCSPTVFKLTINLPTVTSLSDYFLVKLSCLFIFAEFYVFRELANSEKSIKHSPNNLDYRYYSDTFFSASWDVTTNAAICSLSYILTLF
jgi:hypothetical protein